MNNHESSGPEMCCPTCRARQEWSDTCRRCRCDLSLMRRAAETCVVTRRLLLSHLAAGRLREALNTARRYHALDPGPDSTRLLALASLLAGDWATAAVVAS